MSLVIYAEQFKIDTLNPFSTNVPLLYTMETSENQSWNI